MRMTKILIDEEFYDEICRALTDYEESKNKYTSFELYSILVSIQEMYLEGEGEEE